MRKLHSRERMEPAQGCLVAEWALAVTSADWLQPKALPGVQVSSMQPGSSIQTTYQRGSWCVLFSPLSPVWDDRTTEARGGNSSFGGWTQLKYKGYWAGRVM